MMIEQSVALQENVRRVLSLFNRVVVLFLINEDNSDSNNDCFYYIAVR